MARQCTAARRDALHWHPSSSGLTPLSPPRGREKPTKNLSKWPLPWLHLTGTTVRVAHPRQQSSWHTAASQEAGEQHREAAGSCPEPLGRSSFCPLPFSNCQQRDPAAGGQGAGRAPPALGVPVDIGGQASHYLHVSNPDPSTLRPRTAPEPHESFKSSALASWGKGKTLSLFLPLLRLL